MFAAIKHPIEAYHIKIGAQGIKGTPSGVTSSNKSSDTTTQMVVTVGTAGQPKQGN